MAKMIQNEFANQLVQCIAGGLSNMFPCRVIVYLPRKKNTHVQELKGFHLHYGLAKWNLVLPGSVFFKDSSSSLLINVYHIAFVWRQGSGSNSRTQSVKKKTPVAASNPLKRFHCGCKSSFRINFYHPF